MARGGEDDVHGVAFATAQEVAAEMTVALQVTDDGLDGTAASPFTAGSAYTPNQDDAALLAGDEYAGAVGIIAAVAAIDIGARSRRR